MKKEKERDIRIFYFEIKKIKNETILGFFYFILFNYILKKLKHNSL